MKICLIGYGKMGRLLESIAPHEGVTISSILKKGDLICPTVDVCIDFSHPNSVIENVKLAAECQKDLVIGTTGWYDKVDEVRRIASNIGVLYSPNFSIGIHYFLKTIAYAASLYLNEDDYEAAGWEAHHSQKKDAPSGTALALSKVLSPYAPVPFTSTRCGHIPGTHSVIFDSVADSVTLTHQARDRTGFAKGALKAAKWIKGRKGLYTMEDYLS